MKIFIVLLATIFLADGLPTSPSAGTADALESFPWIKASKVKSRFGIVTTTPSPSEQASTSASPQPPQSQQGGLQNQPIMNDEILQSYLAALAARLQQLQAPTTTEKPAVLAGPPPPLPPMPFPKRPLKAKVPKEIKPQDGSPTTETYWAEEKKEYPDSLYDEFYLDWLRKRQVEDIQVATSNPAEPYNVGDLGTTPQSNPPPAPQQTYYPPPAPQQAYPSPYPAVPLQLNPFANPYLYPFGGLKLSKAMATAQMNAALAAMNITTTPKPMKLKLKLSVPGGADLAQVIAGGLSGFPAGTTYELSRK